MTPKSRRGMRATVRWIAGALLASAPASAATFPKPDPEKQFAELKVYDAAGRPWRTAREDWEGARRRVEADPAWRDWLRREREAVDRWSAKHRDRVAWLPGWSHDGVSPKDGSRVTWDERIPREEVEYFSSPSDPRIEITPKLHAWWVVTFRGQHVEMILRAARLFRLTGERRYAEWAAGQVDFYADNFLKWEPQRAGQQARLFWQTLTEATNLVKFTEAVRVLGDAVAGERKARWAARFFRPEVAALNSNMQSIHNIATWQRCAVAQVALLLGDEPMWREALDGRYGLRRQMAEGITSDYLWHEQSLGYNGYVVRAVLSLFTSAGIQGRVAELGAEMATAENLMLSPLYLRFPNGLLPNPADSGAPGRAPNPELYADTYRVFPTTLGLEEAAKQRDWNTLLDPPPASPRAVTLPAVTSRNLESTRMAILKEGPWQVFLHYGQLARSHSQAEALNFAASYGDTDITHDSGTVGYGSPLYRGYYTRGANHNVPLINGEGQAPIQPGVLESFSAQPARVAVAQPTYRPEGAAARVLAIDQGALVDRVTVESSRGPQRLGLALHLQGKVRLPEHFAAADDLASGRPEPFAHWKEARAATFADRVELDVDYGSGLVLRVTLAAPGAFRLWHASTPDVPPRRRDSLYLELAEKSERASFTTTIAPAPR